MPEALADRPGIRLTDPDTKVLCAKDGAPQFTMHAFGKGCGVYLSGFEYSPEAARMLLELLLCLTGADSAAAGLSDHPMVEAAWFPADDTLVAMNSAEEPVDATITCPKGTVKVHLKPLETLIQRI